MRRQHVNDLGLLVVKMAQGLGEGEALLVQRAQRLQAGDDGRHLLNGGVCSRHHLVHFIDLRPDEEVDASAQRAKDQRVERNSGRYLLFLVSREPGLLLAAGNVVELEREHLELPVHLVQLHLVEKTELVVHGLDQREHVVRRQVSLLCWPSMTETSGRAHKAAGRRTMKVLAPNSFSSCAILLSISDSTDSSLPSLALSASAGV